MPWVGDWFHTVMLSYVWLICLRTVMILLHYSVITISEDCSVQVDEVFSALNQILTLVCVRDYSLMVTCEGEGGFKGWEGRWFWPTLCQCHCLLLLHNWPVWPVYRGASVNSIAIFFYFYPVFVLWLVVLESFILESSFHL